MRQNVQNKYALRSPPEPRARTIGSSTAQTAIRRAAASARRGESRAPSHACPGFATAVKLTVTLLMFRVRPYSLGTHAGATQVLSRISYFLATTFSSRILRFSLQPALSHRPTCRE